MPEQHLQHRREYGGFVVNDADETLAYVRSEIVGEGEPRVRLEMVLHGASVTLWFKPSEAAGLARCLQAAAEVRPDEPH